MPQITGDLQREIGFYIVQFDPLYTYNLKNKHLNTKNGPVAVIVSGGAADVVMSSM